MNFSFSEQDKQRFQEMENTLIKEKKLLEPDAIQTSEDIRSALMTFQKILFPLDYLNNLKSMKGGMVNTLEMMRTFARYQPSLFLGVEYSFRIFGEMILWATDDKTRNNLCHAIGIKNFPDQTMIGSIAICEDFVETDTHSSELNATIVDKKIVLNGQKQFVVNAEIADWIAITGNIDGNGAIFIVSPQTKGFDTKVIQHNKTFPDLSIATIQLNNCEIDQKQVINNVQSKNLVQHVHLFENLAYCACSLGMIDQCIETSKSFAQNHQSEKKPMFVHQAVGFSLAEMLTLKQTAELLAFRAAWALETNDPEKQVLNQCAKVFCTEAAEKIASKAMDVLGGQVFSTHPIVDQALQNSKFSQIAGTSSHLARVSIGDMVMK